MNKIKEYWITDSNKDWVLSAYTSHRKALLNQFAGELIIPVIEKSAATDRDRTLRCMQQILKANGSMTYKEFLTNLEGCGMTEDQLGKLDE